MMERRNRILVIDDEASISMAISIMLMNDYDVITAESAEKARQLLQDNPDLILTDIRLPDVCGMDFIKELKNNFDNIPIIVMSCLPEQDMKDELIKSGITLVIRKPFRKDEILCLLSNILSE